MGGVMAERGVLAPLRVSIEAQGLSSPVPTSIPSVTGVAPAMVVILALTLLGLALWLLRGSAPQGGLWSWRLTGAALGTVGVLAWVTGAHAGWQWGLSATGPSRSLIDILLLGGTSVPLWGTLMIAGVPLGSWFSARIAGPVAWRAPAAVELPRRLSGGLLMGAGGDTGRGMQHRTRPDRSVHLRRAECSRDSRDGGRCLVRHPARAGMARVESGIMKPLRRFTS